MRIAIGLRPRTSSPITITITATIAATTTAAAAAIAASATVMTAAVIVVLVVMVVAVMVVMAVMVAVTIAPSITIIQIYCIRPSVLSSIFRILTTLICNKLRIIILFTSFGHIFYEKKTISFNYIIEQN